MEKQQFNEYNSSKGLNYIKNHVKKFMYLIDLYFPHSNFLTKIFIMFDFLCSVIIFGAGINDYFQYEFYKKRFVERKTFIVGRKWKKIIRKSNKTILNPLFDDKAQFNEKYKDYINRDWIDCEYCSTEEFKAFLENHPNYIKKKKVGSGGKGIEFADDQTKIEENDIFKKKYILEEIVSQHPDMAKFNPSSVNTIRVVTLTNNGKVKIMNAVFRAGNGEGKTDNFHSFGIAALMDVNSGIVVTPAVDKKRQKYYFHPKSGHQIVGFKVPQWEKVVEIINKIALVSSDVRYVGWDVSIKEDGEICIIEGNCASDPDITQIPDQVGKWSLYKQEIDRF